MTYSPLSIGAAALSVAALIGSCFAYIRWNRQQTNKNLSSVFLWLAIAANAAVSAIGASPHFSSHWVLASGLLVVNFVLFGLMFCVRNDPRPTGK
jgi:ABC-type spermidine/putrescine transport system permease subunit II